MLFLFELSLLVLLILTIALAEFVGRGQALGTWLGFTLLSVAGEFTMRRRWAALVQQRLPQGPELEEARWARTLLYTWRRTNLLLLIGALFFGLWFWFSR